MNLTKNRRSFVKSALTTGAAGAGLAIVAPRNILAQSASSNLTRGDVAILRLLAAAELIEAHLWQQYAELRGVTSVPQNDYQLALQFLDSEGSQYITSNTLDEVSHAAFLNAHLESKGEQSVNLDRFRTLVSSKADGARDIGRLTNLTS